MKLVGAQQVKRCPADLVKGERYLQPDRLHRAGQSLQMLFALEHIQLTLTGVPVAANALEHVRGNEATRAASVQNTLLPWNDLAVHPGVLRRHVSHTPHHSARWP